MSPAPITPRDTGAGAAKTAGSPTRGRRLVLAWAIVLAAAAASAAQPARTPAPAGEGVIPNPPSHPLKPFLQVVPEDNLLQLELEDGRDSTPTCIGEPQAVRLFTLTDARPRVDGAPAPPEPKFRWKVTGGRFKGEGHTVIWDLSRVRPGRYTATLTVDSRRLYKTVIVGCQTVDSPICPPFRLSCPEVVRAGDSAVIKVSWGASMAASNPNPKFDWSTSAGNIRGEFGAHEVLLDTAGVKAPAIEVRGTLLGYGRVCADNCTITVQPTPTPTPTTLPTLDPAPTSPPPPDKPDPPDAQGTQRLLPWLLGLAALGGAALLAAKLLSLPFYERVAGSISDLLNSASGGGSLSAADLLRSEGASAVIVGGQKRRADVVHCTVFAPPQAAPGDKFIVQVFAHLARQEGRLKDLAAAADPAARGWGSQVLDRLVKRETLLTFTLEMPGLKVNESHDRGESLVWRGAPGSVQFAVDVPKDFSPRTVRSHVRIYSGRARAPVGRIMFMFEVAAAAREPAAAAPVKPEQEVRRYKHAFVSYCSEDRRRVLPIYLGKRSEWRKAGTTDFFDRKDIGAGDHWREVIQKNLDGCDLFVLFWSAAAQCSEEVGREVAYALARKARNEEGLPDFDPLSIDLPVPEPLPVGFAAHNLDDPVLYLIKAEEAIAAERRGRPSRPGDGGV
jgi:hypothetical protein